MDLTRTRRRRVPVIRRVPVCVALAVLVAACGGEPTLGGVVRDPALRVGSVEMTTADGSPMAFRADPGGLLVVYFGYTFCPDICPTTMSDLSIALNDLPSEQADRVTVAFATVDPERDTAEALERYLAYFFEAGIPLRTESPDALTSAAEAFGVQFAVAEHAPGDRYYEVAHTAVTYVIDDTGTVVVEWPFGFDPEQMSSDLRTLLEKEPT